MINYSKKLTHKNLNHYQRLRILKEWDLNAYFKQNGFKKRGFSVHGVYEPFQKIDKLLTILNTIRKQSSEDFYSKSNLINLKSKLFPYLSFLRDGPPLNANLMPMFNLLFETYEEVSKTPNNNATEEILKILHEKFRTPKFKSMIDNYQRTQRKALKNHIDSVKADFAHDHCLTFVHLSLKKEEFFVGGQKVLQFLQWRDNFFDGCRQGKAPVFDDLVRYYWKIFNHPNYGMCLWVIFSFAKEYNTSPNESSQIISKLTNQIKTYWEESITNGYGIALTEHSKKTKNKKSSQIGIVCRDDEQSIARLERLMYTLDALNYLGSIPSISSNNKKQRSQGNGEGPASFKNRLKKSSKHSDFEF